MIASSTNVSVAADFHEGSSSPRNAWNNVFEVVGGAVKVTVSSVPHPMSKEHNIGWIYLETTNGGQRKCLAPTDTPVAEFALADGEEAVAVYAHCNLHGLRKAET